MSEEKVIGQNHKMSVIESTVSVTAGYILTVLIQYLVYPLFGIILPVTETLVISVIIVFAAFVKNFTVRRVFNHLHVNGVGHNAN
jgi:hypothetical protein